MHRFVYLSELEAAVNRSRHLQDPPLLTYDCTLQFVQILDNDSDGDASIDSDFSGYEYKPGYNALDSSDEETLESYM